MIESRDETPVEVEVELPAWMASSADAQDIDLSVLLQAALKEHLCIQD